MYQQETLTIETTGRSVIDLTQRVQGIVSTSGIAIGMCHLLIQHTSASLMISENADAAVLRDLETFMSRQVPDGDPMFTHTQEGPDDMSAHVRSILTQTDLNLPITDAKCALGTWQGIFLWEHRQAPHSRHVLVTLHGE